MYNSDSHLLIQSFCDRVAKTISCVHEFFVILDDEFFRIAYRQAEEELVGSCYLILWPLQ